jgi:integrase
MTDFGYRGRAAVGPEKAENWLEPASGDHDARYVRGMKLSNQRGHTKMSMTAKEIAAMIQASGVSAKAIFAHLKPAGKPAKAISTQQQAENASPGVYRVKDAKGLYFKKGEGGSGSWIYRFRFGGKRPEMGLGALAEATLSEARDRTEEARRQVKAGVNPILARGAAKAETSRVNAIAASRWTFAKAAEDYLAAHASSWKHAASRRLFINPIEKYAYPVIGNKLLDDIRVEDIVAIMDATVAAKAPTAGPRVRLRIEQVINAAIALGQRDASLGNPAAAKLVKAVRPMAKAADEHFRRIPLDDAPAIFRALKERAEDSSAFAAWTFMIACASRPGEEALKARWSEIDRDKRLWTVPAARMKNGKEFVVPLSSVALAVLKQQEGRRVDDAVFPGISGSPLSYTAFSRAPAKAGIDAGSPHSWRSIFRDACGDKLRVDRDLAEAALAHSLGKVEAAHRRETAVEARRAVMEAYADWLMGEGVNVIAFKSRA